jgi:hypothetical protein
MDAILVSTLLVPSTVALLGALELVASRHGEDAEATAELEPAMTYSLLAYLGRLMTMRGMNRSSTIARTRSGGMGL